MTLFIIIDRSLIWIYSPLSKIDLNLSWQLQQQQNNRKYLLEWLLIDFSSFLSKKNQWLPISQEKSSFFRNDSVFSE